MLKKYFIMMRYKYILVIPPFVEYCYCIVHVKELNKITFRVKKKTVNFAPLKQSSVHGNVSGKYIYRASLVNSKVHLEHPEQPEKSRVG